MQVDCMSADRGCDIAFALDERFVHPTIVAVHSLLRHWDSNVPLRLTLVDCGITEESKRTFQRLVDLRKFVSVLRFVSARESVKGLPGIGHLSSAAYARFFLPFLIPEADRILYLDGDICVLENLSSFSNVESVLALASVDVPSRLLLSREALSYCKDDPEVRLGGPLRNSGVLLINADRWRNSDVTKRLVGFVQRYKSVLQFADQDALNAVCGQDIQDLSPDWNVQSRDWRPSVSAKIIHFTGSHKPWNSGFTNPLVRLYLKEARLAFKASEMSYTFWSAKRAFTAANAAARSRWQRWLSGLSGE